MQHSRQTPRRDFPRWTPWVEACETPYDLGWLHGKQDANDGKDYGPRAGVVMTRDEFMEYRQGYREAREGEGD